MTPRSTLQRVLPCVIVVIGLAGCGGSPEPSASRPSSPAATITRLPCADVKTFVVTSAPIGEELQYDSTAEQAIARVVASDKAATSAKLIGDPSRTDTEADRTMRANHEGITEAVRYALLDPSGTVVEETVVAKTPDGWIALQFDSCA